MSNQEIVPHTILIVFLKNPIEGKVKTRLAKSIGSLSALETYRKLINITLDAAFNSGLSVHLFFSDFIENDFNDCKKGFMTHIQQGNELGARMLHAFDTFDPSIPKIIIGSDCAEITSEILLKAARQLTSKDCVIGPTFDGGYYLLGFKKVLPDVFRNKTWSTSSVFHDTIKDLEHHQFRYQVIDKLRDIDTLEDLQNSILWKNANR